MQPITFSIIIPAFNCGGFIKTAISSVLEQTYGHFEILVIDGLSTDETLPNVDSFQDSRIKVFSEKDNGIYDAMNKGISLANGEWLYFLGSDDRLYDKHVLENMAATIQQQAPDALYGNVFSEGLGSKYDGAFDAEKILHKNISHQALFLKRSLVHALGFFDTSYKACADWEYNFRWFFKTGIKKIYTDIIVAHFGYEGVSSTFRDDYFLDRKTVLYLLYGRAQVKIRRRMWLLGSEIKRHLLAKRFSLTARIFFKIPELLIVHGWKDRSTKTI